VVVFTGERIVKKIAALFVATNGPYFLRDYIDCYDESRDAMTYSDSLPVIAHPPCNLWGKFALVNYKRWGGEHNRLGNDGGKFNFALDAVNRCGGVIEHPAHSYAWREYTLERPRFGVWIKSGRGWVTEVWQSAYGHKANKKTWLYAASIVKPKDLRWEKVVGSHQIGQRDQRGKAANKPTVTRKEAIHTPEAFLDELVEIAKRANWSDMSTTTSVLVSA
jgi:hypothetical protein